MKKRGLILVNGYYYGDEVRYQIKRYMEEFKKLDVDLTVRACNFLVAHLNREEPQLNDFNYDFALYLDKDKYLSVLLEKAGIRVFNKAEAIELCDDKMLTYLAITGSGIEMPITLSGPLCFRKTTIDKELLNKVEEILGYPVIIKKSFGALGRQVYLANNREELVEKAQEVIYQPHLFQQYIPSSHGKDMRIIVIGKKAVAWMLRKSDEDFRSNLGGSGQAYKIEADQTFLTMAEKVSEVLDLDFCGVDLMFGEQGQPVFCEANSNAFFSGIEKTSGVNVAGLYCQHIYSEIYGTK